MKKRFYITIYIFIYGISIMGEDALTNIVYEAKLCIEQQGLLVHTSRKLIHHKIQNIKSNIHPLYYMSFPTRILNISEFGNFINNMLYVKKESFLNDYEEFKKKFNNFRLPITTVGSYFGQWDIPLSKIKNCYSFGISMHSDLSFEIGLLALTKCKVFMVGNQETKDVCNQLKKNIKDNKVSYIDYEKIYDIAIDKSAQLNFIENDNYVENLPKESAIRLEMGSDNSYVILNQLLLSSIPSVLCLNCNNIDSKDVLNYISNIKNYSSQKGYTLISNKHGRYLTLLRNDLLPDKYIFSDSLMETNEENENDIAFRKDIKIKTMYENLLAKDIVPTEYIVYKILKDNPININIRYFAIPWVTLIRHSQSSKIPNLKTIVKEWEYGSNGGFTVCQHVRYRAILPILKKLGIDTLFAPHVDKEYFGLRIYPFPQYPVNGKNPSGPKDIWYSFIGANDHIVRTKLLNMQHPQNTVIINRHAWHFAKNEQQKQLEKEEYQQLLSRSRFSLCPRGVGVSTIRFWESLQAGAIPVVMSDNFQLPSIINWKECVVFIAEKDIHTIKDRLQLITKKEEEKMRKKCYEAFHLLCSGDNFVNTIKHYYGIKIS